jgi:hypothetical protein
LFRQAANRRDPEGRGGYLSLRLNVSQTQIPMIAAHTAARTILP